MPRLSDHNLTDGVISSAGQSLRRRMLIALLLVFVMGLGISAIQLYGTRDELRRAVLLIQAGTLSQGFSAEQNIETLPRHYAGDQMSYTLYAADGSLLDYSAHMPRPSRLRTQLLQTQPQWWHWSPYAGRTINVPVQLADGAVLMVSRTDTAEREMLDRMLLNRVRQSLILLLPLVLGAGLLIMMLLNWTLRPVGRATQLAGSIGPDNPGRRIPLKGLPTEFHPLASAANSALDRLGGAYEAERRFIADAAHELRTPLTVLDLRLQDSRRSGLLDWPILEKEMRQLRRLVAQLLELARQDGAGACGSPLVLTNVSRMSREVTGTMLPMFEEQGRAIVAEIADGQHCLCHAHELREALINLLDNALVHGRGETFVVLRRESSELVIEISDQGPGVPEQDQERMFQRFHKGRQGSEGTGLGLAIVRRIVQNAGGRVAFVPDQPSTIRITLPV
ncbi:sensor histidine kinase [Halopseudomonas pelagia]|uniref:histidine kinase n=1 Tax=Halopseudomonas pelagia TaxID=553151 RepID=A0AA91U0B3_9GAMM|nr:HAMP domain-containing sensor histidine kinase [Halopseudomonas pelagia]PCC98122.1 two-component sensor histidine kinase [Halopseudomonas pelagia]QFY55065.1 sensor histidine kinase [Halopseudomonas pelagia]